MQDNDSFCGLCCKGRGRNILGALQLKKLGGPNGWGERACISAGRAKSDPVLVVLSHEQPATPGQ